MNKSLKKLISVLSSTVFAASMLTVPVSVSAAEYVPLMEGDTVISEWKFDFGSDATEAGYTQVSKNAHPVLGDLETGEETGYGFVGTYEDDFNFNQRYDSLLMKKGHVTNLIETENGVGSIGSEAGTNGYEYPTRFAMYVNNGTYYRVRATLTNLEAGDATNVALYAERKHPIVSYETIKEGEELTVEFSVDVESNYFEKSSPKGVFEDDMLNIVMAGKNAALKSMTIQQVEPGITLWVLGDSTVTDGNDVLPFFELDNYTGVGTGLSKYLPKNIAVSNQGEGGLAAGDNYHFNIVKNRIKKGDYMYVEYGHNHKTDDSAAGYLGHLDKYYQACKAVGATLVLVGPIDRHNNYNSSTNTWSTTLAHFSRAAKGYVDCMLWGGETAANTYVSTYKASGEEAAENYKTTLLAGDKTSTVTNVAFVDLNQPSLDWFTEITAKGSVMGTEYTNNSKLIDYYFTTAKGGKTDGTHPNDMGAQALAYFFFTDAAAKIAEYPALAGLLKKYDGTVPAENSTPSGAVWSPVSQEIMDAGWAGGAGWPDAVSEYKYPARVRMLNFDDEGKLVSADVEVLDNSIMPSYGRGIVAAYNSDGTLAGLAISNNSSETDGYVGWVDNSTGSGIQTLAFDGSDLTVKDDQTVKVFLWSMEDSEGYPLTLRAYTESEYTPITYNYILTNDSLDGPENFHYYGLKANSAFTNKNGWSISGISATSKNDGEAWYGSFTGSGTMTKQLTKAQSSGLIGVSGKIKYTSGDVTIQLSDGNNQIDCMAIPKSEINAGEWVDFSYMLDMDKGEHTLTIGDVTTETSKVDSLNKLNADDVKPTSIASLKISATNAAFDLTALAVTSNDRTEKLPVHSVNAAYANGSDETMGTVSAASDTAQIGSTVEYTASNNAGYKFDGFYATADASGEPLTRAKKFNARVLGDTTVYAKFVVHEGFYFEDTFEDYETGKKIVHVGNNVENAPDPVKLGSITLYAGRRANGTVDGKSYISIEESGNNKYLVCAADKYASNSRGVKFMFDAPVEFDEKVIVWEFDIKADGAGMALLSDIGSYKAADVAGLNSGKWVNAKLIFDKANTKQYLVISDTDGNILNVTTSALKATKIEGASFYDYDSGTISFDNMKIYDFGTANTTAMMPVETTISAPAKAEVTIAGNKYIAGDDGTFKTSLIPGKTYSVTAVCGGYEDYEGELTLSETNTMTVPMAERTTATTTVTVNYVDTEGNELKSSESIATDSNGSDIYVGDAFTLTGMAYTAAVKLANAENAAMYDVYVYDETVSDSLEIAALEETNTINIKFKKLDGVYYDYEDFSTRTDDWGFTEGQRDNVSVANGIITLLAQNKAGKTDTKVLDDAIADESKLTVSFDYRTDAGSGRASRFNLLDTNGNVIFSIFNQGYKNGLGGYFFALNANATKESANNPLKGVGDWLTVTLELDFEAQKMSGKVMKTADGSTVTEFTDETITTAENLGKITAYDDSSLAPIYLDNFGIMQGIAE